MTKIASIETCRLCGGLTAAVFHTQLIQKYDVTYYRCDSCNALQTEQPFWLEECYAHNLGDMDCGSAQRNLSSATASMIVARLWGMHNVIDHGGGDGLLCRLLRDYGLNCFVEDKYAVPTYAQGYTLPDFAEPDMILAFEVFEHFSSPSTEVAALFARRPKILFGSTQEYTDHGPQWDYLSKHSGHHIFFYSAAALRWIGHQFGYRAVRSGPYFIFVREDIANQVKLTLLRLLTHKVTLRLLRGALVVSPHRGVARDIAKTRTELGRD